MSAFSVSLLGMGLPSAAVSFDFGRGNGWSAFTIFILMDNGEIFLLCPVLPSSWCVAGTAVPRAAVVICAVVGVASVAIHGGAGIEPRQLLTVSAGAARACIASRNSILPGGLLQGLHTDVEARLKQLQDRGADDDAAAVHHETPARGQLEKQLRWLNLLLDCARPATSAGTSSEDELALGGDRYRSEVLSSAQLPLRVSLSSALRAWPPRRQGPLSVQPPEAVLRDPVATSLVCIAAAPTVLAVGNASGSVAIFILLDAVEPAWQFAATGELAASAATTVPTLYMCERVDLDLPDPSLADAGTSAVGGVSLLLLFHALLPDQLFVAHHTGAHRIALKWLHDLREFLESTPAAVAADKSVPVLDLGESVVQQVVRTMLSSFSPLSPIRGAVVLTSRAAQQHLVILTADLKCVSVPVSCGLSDWRDAAQSDARATRPTRSDATLDMAYHMRVRQLLSDAADHLSSYLALPRRAASDGADEDEASLTLLIETSEQLRNMCVAKLHQAHVEMQTRYAAAPPAAAILLARTVAD